MSKQMLIRIDAALKEKLAKLSKAEGKNSSQVVRELIESYICERDISGYIDGLWNRIGKRLESQRVKPADIRRAIKKSRSSPA